VSGSTPELNLATAVDADDNADYLTINLANSLRTVDALFNNVTGHNHGGAHQGGPVAPAAIADGSITNAKLAPDVARANLLTNGGFEIWQRGNGPFTANNAYTADMWSISWPSGTPSVSISKETSVIDSGSQASLKYVVTSLGGASYVFARQWVKMSDQTQLRGRQISVSIRAQSSVVGAVLLRVVTDGTAGPDISSGATSQANTWQTLTVTLTVPLDATFVAVDVRVSAVATAYIDNAMLVVGSQAANYVPLHPADDLARCLRYYENIISPGANFNYAVGQALSATTAYTAFSWKVRKAVTPTVTFNGSFQVGQANGTQSTVTMNSANISTDLAQFYATGASGLVAGNASLFTMGAATVFGIEANP